MTASYRATMIEKQPDGSFIVYLGSKVVTTLTLEAAQELERKYFEEEK